MPKYRKELYSIWRACERFNFIPPDIKSNRWDDLSVLDQAMLLSYSQIRLIEETE